MRRPLAPDTKCGGLVERVGGVSIIQPIFTFWCAPIALLGPGTYWVPPKRYRIPREQFVTPE
jgi:hypothetical protein